MEVNTYYDEFTTADSYQQSGHYRGDRNAAYEIIDRKGATCYAIGLGLVQLAGSILRDEISIFTLSSLVEDYYGLSGVCLNLPSLINKNGIKQVLKIPLSESEGERKWERNH